MRNIAILENLYDNLKQQFSTIETTLSLIEEICDCGHCWNNAKCPFKASGSDCVLQLEIPKLPLWKEIQKNNSEELTK